MNSKHNIKSVFVWLSIILGSVSLAGCGGDTHSKKMPEEVAYEFLDAIYNKKDLKLIKIHSTDKVAKLADHYRSIKSIQRHLIDLRLNSATIQVSDVSGDFFRKSKKDTKVELHIRGEWEGGVVADDRFLTLKWQNNRWKVSKIDKS